MRRLACLLFLPGFLALMTPAAAATTLQDLREQGHLEIASDLDPPAGVVPGQKVRLHLEIAVDILGMVSQKGQGIHVKQFPSWWRSSRSSSSRHGRNPT